MIDFRKALIEDRETLYQIHLDSVKKLCARQYATDKTERWFDGRSPDNYTGATEWGGIWIASIDDEPVAFIEFFMKTISMLYIRGRSSGRGIGRLLMEHALATMPGDNGLIGLEALLNAVPFYEKFGFEKVADGQLRRKTGLVIDTVLMERRPGR